MAPPRSRRWIYTLNNYSDEEVQAAKKIDARYHCFGFEVGDSGTPHLQGSVVFHQAKTLVYCRKVLSRARWAIMERSIEEASDYCKKDGDFFESGKIPQQGKRSDLDAAISTLKTHGYKRVAEDHPREFVKFHRGFKELALTIGEKYEHHSVRGIWIYGPPGTGKSHAARNFDEDIYIKAQNKWFDGYAGESVILLDDLDTHTLGHHLKIWADKYACTGETKGGTVQLRHKLFVVTSNYSIDELFKEDENMAKALERRFKLIEKLDKASIVDFLVLK